MLPLDPSKILSLKLGDIVETPSIMVGLTKESTFLQVDNVQPESIGFRVLFFGVRIGSVSFTKSKGEPTWTFNPV